MTRRSCRLWFGLGTLAAALWLAACGSCRDKPGKPGPSPKPSAAAGEKPVVEGVVRLAPGSELPAYAPEEMEKRILKKLAPEALPPVCSPPKTTDRQPVQVTPEGTLAGVMLAPSNFSHQPSRPPLVHEVVLEDCRLTPRLVVGMKGDTLRVRSTVNYPFMPSYNEGAQVRTLLPGQTYDVPMDKQGVSPLWCGFTASCGRTDVVVMLHPYYTVTDANGHFRFDDFPAGEKVTLSAWHPLFQESHIELRVEPGEHREVELVLVPIAATPAPPSQTGPTQSPSQNPAAPAAPK